MATSNETQVWNDLLEHINKSDNFTITGEQTLEALRHGRKVKVMVRGVGRPLAATLRYAPEDNLLTWRANLLPAKKKTAFRKTIINNSGMLAGFFHLFLNNPLGAIRLIKQRPVFQLTHVITEEGIPHLLFTVFEKALQRATSLRNAIEGAMAGKSWEGINLSEDYNGHTSSDGQTPVTIRMTKVPQREKPKAERPSTHSCPAHIIQINNAIEKGDLETVQRLLAGDDIDIPEAI